MQEDYFTFKIPNFTPPATSENTVAATSEDAPATVNLGNKDDYTIYRDLMQVALEIEQCRTSV